MEGGVLVEYKCDMVFLALPWPSFSRSQFNPSARPPGWQLLQEIQRWKDPLASS
jgi:hypothetical protein